MIAERTLPHNLDAERSVLGAILLRNEALDEAAELIEAEDFYRDAHRRIFAKFVDLSEKHSAIDFVTVREALGSELAEVGGPGYVARLVDGVPRTTNVAHYARIIHEKAVLRRLIARAQQITEQAYDEDAEADAVLQEAEAHIFSIGRSETRGDLVHASALTPELLQTLERLYESRSAVTGLSTGFKELDAYTGGFKPADLIVIGARSSVGKSTIAQDIARHVALTLGQTVAYFTPETSRKALMMRQAIALANVDGFRVRNGRITNDALNALVNAVGQIEGGSLWIDDTPGIRPMEIRSKCRRLKATYGLALIIIDYIQMMQGDRGMRFENRQVEMAYISRTIKAIAKELGVPVLALAQLLRKVDERADHRPTIADLRESGAIENDADVVGLLHRPGKYEPDNDALRGKAELNIAKQRDGPVGVIDLVFIDWSTRFENAAQEYAS